MTGTNDFPDKTSRSPQDLIGMRFPTISAETLAGTQATIPDSAEGSVTLVVMAFKRSSQPQIDSWLQPFVSEFGGTPGFTFYEIPMISSLFKLMAPMIDRGMRAGIPREKHECVVNYYGDIEEYRRILLIDDLYKGYAFILDRDGIIRWEAEGDATEEQIKKMISVAKLLA